MVRARNQMIVPARETCEGMSCYKKNKNNFFAPFLLFFAGCNWSGST